MKASRLEVYEAVNTERDYQEKRWNREPPHSIVEYLVYMRDYVEEALHNASRVDDAIMKQGLLNNVRKVTGLGVACMEHHGAPKRKG